jgi:dihydroflavonol-4-reductase
MWEQMQECCFWSGRSVALTGATGFVGHHLASLLRRLGANVIALVRTGSPTAPLQAAGVNCLVAELDNIPGLAQACHGCDCLFHLAGEVNFENDWDRCVRTNVDGTRHVLEAARQACVRRLIVTSSIVALGASERPSLLDETVQWNLASLRIPYVTTKWQAQQIALSASATVDGPGRRPEVIVVNPSCVIGPDDFRHSEFGTLCQRFWRGRVPFYFGGGANFVDVRDVAAGHLLAAQLGRPGQRYLLGGVNRTYGTFFTELARIAGRAIFRLRLPGCLAQPLAALDSLHRRHRRRQGRSTRPQLTAGQAALLCKYFFFTSQKAFAELGYRPRPFAETLRRTYAFWERRRSA